MPISLTQARGVFTDVLSQRFTDSTTPTAFLQGFFRSYFNRSKLVSFEIDRNGRPVSVVVQRYSNGQFIGSTKIDEKRFEPPFLHNRMALTDHDLYDNVVGMIAAIDGGALSPEMTAVFTANLSMITDDMSKRFMKIKNMHLRRIELMCLQCLQSSIVTLESGDNIDFKRKSGSIVDLGAGNYWANGVDPYAALENQCNWIKENGNSGASEFNGLFGAGALNDLKNNVIFKERQDLNNFDSGKLTAPTRPKDGAVYHGVLYCGENVVHVWTYGQYYDHPTTQVSTKYLDDKEVILIAEDAVLDLPFSLAPQIIENGTIPQTAEFLVQDEMLPIQGVHNMHIKVVPLPLPISIDRLSTIQVKA